MNFYQKGGSEYLFVCDLFKELRKKSNLSQADAADHIGVNQSFISKFENGHTGIDLFDALALLDLYGIDHVDFFYMLDQFKKKEIRKGALLHYFLSRS
ncbi:helix-turn-helix domain-containing protein [Vibrio parahaemolyticus]|uniref:helix-turn-helix domain-containing protein n=1 Tax=Vibrio parahaemolyticus TaxID=670 RepID=UPI001122B15A|nr:helix-turn-helix transcriptional regulator [Vibrio parahaemolyticus]MBE5145747.1 helix-turn-helix transcriptional regulator [Vibrio parahaemolyticus]TOI60647.1 hypothetical protein CGI55_20725 [Vibrio parahaemolyticus]